MPFPKNLRELKAQGYLYSNDAVCKGCGEDIEWWSSPAGNKIPMNPMTGDSSEAVAHWTTCSNASDFRKRSK